MDVSRWSWDATHHWQSPYFNGETHTCERCGGIGIVYTDGYDDYTEDEYQVLKDEGVYEDTCPECSGTGLVEYGRDDF